ncbi:Apc15p protein-domain-containing protein [Echria macrotheca]|uniref:Apc15p protein-domain-containing protein n=1 Tax=Echria macrotheca TaxID=438768 RepID=A0AAJ0B432_9PEZI|nr:Apc15p protein-domain-containing protein [Echria macrotheca]
MFSVLPDLTPRDSHSLWYVSSRRPHQNPYHLQNGDPSGSHHPLSPDVNLPANNNVPPNLNSNNPRMRLGQHAGAQAIERSALGRLRDDERTNERRRANAANLGSTWLKPPGVAKTLFQMREERREAEEHAEAMRREMLAQELAEAEAAEAGGAGVGGEMMGDEDGDIMEGEGGEMMTDGDEMMMDGGEGGGRDLDDDIPDADAGGFGFDGASDDDDDEDDDEDEDEEEEEDDEGDDQSVPGGQQGGRQLRRVHQRELQNRVATMRATEDRMREMMARGGQGPAAGRDLYTPDEDIDEEDQAHMLEEDDLVGSMYPDELEPELDMDANLDDDIPEAESLGGGYEHTDSEASLTSDDDTGRHNISYGGGMRAPQLPPPRSSMGGGPPRSSMGGGGGGGGPRSSLDISSILSRDGSSILGSSPRLPRRG